MSPCLLTISPPLKTRGYSNRAVAPRCFPEPFAIERACAVFWGGEDAERVAHGGHNIPVKEIQRRFPRTLHNLLNDYSNRVDRCLCFMNDGEMPVLVFEQVGENGDILHEVYYKLLQKEAEA